MVNVCDIRKFFRCNYIANNDDDASETTEENVSIEKRILGCIRCDSKNKRHEGKSPKHVKCLMIFQQNRTNRNFI